MVRRLDHDLDLHLVAEHHAAAFHRAIPLHTVIEPVHGGARFEPEPLPAVQMVAVSHLAASGTVIEPLQSRNVPRTRLMK